ncbi:MAG TPA: LysM peptidoglycan-binding domain-containing protein [Planctomycetaceae bacterium]|nr:LysM peptidoglycan-binding domain-containing protein [Planctomycetaceae bacterium]
MATPLPQADSGLPRRTTFQSPLAHGAVAGGEKTLTGETEVKKADSAEKPALRTAGTSAAPPARSQTSPAGDGEKDAAEKTEKPTAPDWGLWTKKPRRSRKLKIALGIALAVVVCGGCAACVWFFPASHETSTIAEADDPASAAAPPEPSRANVSRSANSPNDTSDPFDDEPKIASSPGLRKPTSIEPRRVGGAPEAVPIGHRNSPQDLRKKPARHPLALEDDVESGELEDSELNALNQSEPEIDGDDSGPSIGREIENPRGSAIQRRPEPSAGVSRARAGDAPSSRERSNERLEKDPSDDLSDDELDGYSVADKKPIGNPTGSKGGPAISMIDVPDDSHEDEKEKLEGFVPAEATTRRAASKTVVIRAADALATASERASSAVDDQRNFAGKRSMTGSVADNDLFQDDESLTTDGQGGAAGARSARAAMKDARRDSPAAELATNGRPAGGPRAGGQGFGPSTESYRVEADDNFWKISRKLYGTARYYQALMRHNQDRVPDPQKLRPGMVVSTPPVAFLEQKYSDLIEKAHRATAPSGPSNTTVRRPQFEKPLAAQAPTAANDENDAQSEPLGYFYSKAGEPMYRIGADDTLGSIAQRHLGRASRWTEIYEKNREILKSPDDLTLGAVIRLPSDASRLSLVPESERRR